MSNKDLSNLFDLSGKTALVTGGTGIQGRRVTRGLAANGANVAVIDLDAETADALASSLRDEYGVEAVGIACDISDPAAVRDMVAAVEDGLGDIHVLHLSLIHI